MPKLFTCLVAIEEVALGHVMNLLHRTPGVARVDLLMGDTPHAKAHAKANGHANGELNGEDKKPHANTGKKRPHFDVTGADFLIGMLAKKHPLDTPAIKKAFEKAGRQPGSTASLLYTGKKDGILQVGEGGYSLTKKGRDKARYV